MTEIDSKTLSKQRFNKFAKSYVTSTTHARGIELEVLVELAQPKPAWSVLDVATGGGHTALKFSKYVTQVIATDITPNMLAVAKKFIHERGVYNVSFGTADAENLPFDNNSFDLVTCRIAAHHFPNPAKFVRESARVLKQNHLLLVQDQVVPDEKESARIINAFEQTRDPSHNQAFSEPEWVDFFHQAGLKVEDIEQIQITHKFVSWVEIQSCSKKTIQLLETMIHDSPPAVQKWLQPLDFGTREATFINHHILIKGRK